MAEARKKILCIEDDREAAALIVEELADQGFDPIAAHDGREGLDAILKHMPDLVLCDINLPVMSGFEVLQRLNDSAPRFGRMPFVFLTAMSDRENEMRGRRLGAGRSGRWKLQRRNVPAAAARRLAWIDAAGDQRAARFGPSGGRK